MIRKLVISLSLILGMIISAVIERGVVSKHYATLAFALAFSAYWTVEFILDYIEFRKTYNKKYDFYKARLVNSTNLSLEQIEKDHKLYYKKFKRSMLKESFLKIMYPACALSLSVAFILSMAL